MSRANRSPPDNLPVADRVRRWTTEWPERALSEVSARRRFGRDQVKSGRRAEVAFLQRPKKTSRTPSLDDNECYSSATKGREAADLGVP